MRFIIPKIKEGKFLMVLLSWTETQKSENTLWQMGGYISLPWLVIPFSAPDTERLRDFNFIRSSTRIVMECSFGRLKNTWLFLHNPIRQPDVKFLLKLIAACCILHNILLDFGVDITENFVPGIND